MDEELYDYEPTEEDFAVEDVPVEYPLLSTLSRIVLAGISLAVLPALLPSKRIGRRWLKR